MAANQERLRYLFNRYIDNSCTREELDELFAVVRESRNSEEFNLLLKETWNDIQPGEPVRLLNEEEIFRQAINSPSIPIARKSGFAWLKVAAVFFIISCGVAIAYFTVRPARLQSAEKAAVARQSTIESHKLITLPDGSTVLLNGHSSLDFPQAFSGSTREVTLVGEAYFDIRKDHSKPFIIHSGKLQTIVLGTAFNIRAYADEAAVVVTVTRGKVKVESENKILGIITPNHQISFNSLTSEVVENEVAADSVINWKQKDLVFDNITFSEAATIIHQRYGADIRFANDKLLNCRFTASFLNGNPLEQVLKVICDLNKAAYSVMGDKVLISGEGCP